MADQTNTPPRPMFDPAVPPGDRPLSPHLQIWGWTVTMASSIGQRATGIALYAGFALMTAWLACAAIGEAAYTQFQAVLGSPLGLVVLVGFTWAQLFHLAKGIVHLIWDSGHMMGKGAGKNAAVAVFALSVVLTALIWVIALSVKG